MSVRHDNENNSKDNSTDNCIERCSSRLVVVVGNLHSTMKSLQHARSRDNGAVFRVEIACTFILFILFHFLKFSLLT